MAKKKRKVRVKRTSSVQQRDVERAEEGKALAAAALEEEFRSSAHKVIEELVEPLGSRMTADDMWDELDARMIFTDHPKGSAGLLRQAEKLQIIQKVPGVKWPSRRSNPSRELQVYEQFGTPATSSETRTVRCAQCNDFMGFAPFNPGPVFCTRRCQRAHYRGRRRDHK